MITLDNITAGECRLAIRSLDFIFHKMSTGQQWAQETHYLYVRGTLYDIIEYTENNIDNDTPSDETTILKHDMKTVNVLAVSKAYAREIYKLSGGDDDGEKAARFARLMYVLSEFLVRFTHEAKNRSG